MISLITNENVAYLVIILSLNRPNFLQIRDKFSNLLSIAFGIDLNLHYLFELYVLNIHVNFPYICN